MRNSCLSEKNLWSKHEWVDKQFSEDIRSMLKQRMLNGKNNISRDLAPGFRRATKAIRNLSYWKTTILKDLLEAEWTEDRWNGK